MDILNKYKRMSAAGLADLTEATYYHNTPAAFHTYRAYYLFTIAIAGGWFMWEKLLNPEQFLQWLEAHQPLKSQLQLGEIPHKLIMPESSPIRTQPHLAYWCIRASTYLGLDKVSSTNWEPFEDLFGLPHKTLCRTTGPLDLKRDTQGRIVKKREEYTAEIDAFFDALETALNPEQQ